MKPFELIIKVNENGRPAIRFEPNEPHAVVEAQELLKIALQLVGSVQIGGKPKEEKPAD